MNSHQFNQYDSTKAGKTSLTLTKQGVRVSCLAQTGFAAFGKTVQLISGSPNAETE